jgi:hypothetical protein
MKGYDYWSTRQLSGYGSRTVYFLFELLKDVLAAHRSEI